MHLHGHAVVGLVLAAGGGSRMGRPKAGLLWEGQPLVRHQCATLRPAVEDVVVVTGADADSVAALVPEWATVVRNADWHTGLAGSLRAGASALVPGTEVVVIVPVDQPLITTDLIQHALAAHRRSTVVVIDYGGHWGHPMVWDRALLEAAVDGLTGDRGAREWLNAHPESVIVLPQHGSHAQLDLDTPDDLDRLRAQLRQPGPANEPPPGG